MVTLCGRSTCAPEPVEAALLDKKNNTLLDPKSSFFFFVSAIFFLIVNGNSPMGFCLGWHFQVYFSKSVFCGWDVELLA